MLTARTAAAALVVLCATPAVAQLSNRSIAVEAGVSGVGRGGDPVRPALAIAASAWLEGNVEAVARLAVGSAPAPSGRAADALSGVAGLRVSLLPDPIRPQVGVELGWARIAEGDEREDRFVAGLGAGVEAFPARDVSIALRTTVRLAGTATGIETTLGFAAYF